MPLSEQEVLHMPFSIKRHKETFSHYLEAIIRPDGTVEYAMPSHTEKLLSIIMEKHNINREEALALCPPEFYCDYINWLVQESGCISLWTKFHLGIPNPAQAEMLRTLTAEGIYDGPL